MSPDNGAIEDQMFHIRVIGEMLMHLLPDTVVWPLSSQISLSPTNNIAKLDIPIRRWLARHPFVIDPQRIVTSLQQATNRWQADRILRSQSLFDFAQRLMGPLQPRDWTPAVSSASRASKALSNPGAFFQSRGDRLPYAASNH